jgi:putative ABC transport system permease protein
VANISHALWRNGFGGDPGMVGRDLLVNGEKCTVVGVMPRGFEFPPGEADAPDVWVPARFGVPSESLRGSHSVHVLGRIRAGSTLEQGRAELDALTQHWTETGSAGSHHFDTANHTIVGYALHDEVVRGVRPALRMLFGAVALVLLIACVNVANLLLMRAEGRRRETAVRAAMGAGLARLARQFVAEGLLLSVLGGAAGVALAAFGVAMITAGAGDSLPRSQEVRVDWRAVAFTACVCVATGVGFGLTPLAHAARQKLHATLKSAAASTTPGGASQRVRQALVVGELALALVLLVGTGLMVRAFWSVQRVDGGFDPAGVVTASVSLPDASHPAPPDVARFWRLLERRLRGTPEIGSAALCTGLPPAYASVHNDTGIEGYVAGPGMPPHNVQYYQYVSAGYFEAVGVRLVEGRPFDQSDVAGAPAVAIVNQTMARTFWGNRSPIGGRVRPAAADKWYMVVGVVADVKNGGLEAATGTELYLPFDQVWEEDDDGLRRVYVVARSPARPAAVMNAVRRAVHDVDPSLPLADVRTMDDVVAAARSRPRFLAALLTTFSAAALFLAAVGLYGVISYGVAQRTREFGVRFALGARPAQVMRPVLARAVTLTACGVAVGLAGALALTRLMEGLLFGITPSDPATFAAVSLLLGAVALAASWVAVRRAAKVEPMAALRYE